MNSETPKSNFNKGQIVQVQSKFFSKPRSGIVVDVTDHTFAVLVAYKSNPVIFSRYTQHAFTKGWWI